MKVPSGNLSRLPLKPPWRSMCNEMWDCAAACIRNTAPRRNITPKPRSVRAIVRIEVMGSYPASSVEAPEAKLVIAHFNLILHTQEKFEQRTNNLQPGP